MRVKIMKSAIILLQVHINLWRRLAEKGIILYHKTHCPHMIMM